MPRVSIYGTSKSFEIKENEILYDSLYDQGEILPHGCLSGSCGACRIEVIEGKEHLQEAGLIESNTIEAVRDEFAKIRGTEFVADMTIRLSCRARVKGDVVFKPLK